MGEAGPATVALRRAVVVDVKVRAIGSSGEKALRLGVVQVGLGGLDVPFPLTAVVAKEIDFKGTFRFYEQFEQAVALLGSGRIDVAPLHSATLPVERAKEAFDLASDKSQSMKVQLAF